MAIRRFPKGNEGKTQTGLPLGNPVCLWQTELFKLNLKSSPSSSGYNRRRRLATRSSGKQQAECTAVRAASIVCPEESPLVRPQAHSPPPRWGLTRRFRRGGRTCSPMGRSIASDGDPKGVQGGERKATLLASIGDNFVVRNSPLAGLDAPTTARIGTGRPKGRSHFSFGGERKVCKRKPAARRLREKGFYCPF